MPKESFEQFVKRQKEKLDKVERIVKEIKEKWKEDLERFEESKMIEKAVRDLKEFWKENERTFLYDSPFIRKLSRPFPEVSPSFLERVSNKFLEEFDWDEYRSSEPGLFPLVGEGIGTLLSFFLKKNIERYFSEQKSKGLKEKEIKPIVIHLKVKELPVRLSYLGCEKPEKLHLIIEGDCECCTGDRMEGGVIIVKGNCGDHTGWRMKGGKIIVKGNCLNYTGEWMKGGKIIVEKDCRDHTGKEMKGGEIIVKGDCKNYTGEEMKGGKIVVEGNCKDHTGEGMKNGEIIVEKECGYYTGSRMKGGTLILKGEVKSFKGVSFPSNQGTVIWKEIKIWENGDWTKEGKEMVEKGEILYK